LIHWICHRNEVKNVILKKDVTFAEDVWESISEEAQYFVSSLLHKIPENRPTARKALAQEFIVRHYNQNDPLENNTELKTKIHDSIKQFIRSSLFRKVIFQMIASRYPAEEILDLTHIFTFLDTSRRGTLSFSDFKLLLLSFHYHDSELRSMFDCIVSNECHVIPTIFDYF
jgi:serine/threonine protein kinase